MNTDRTRASRKAARRYNVSPVARAVRSVLTISAAALMFSGSGVVLAKAPVFAPLPSARAALSHDFAKVTDLTRIDDAWIPKSVVDEEFESLAAPMMSAASAMSFATTSLVIDDTGPVDDPTVLPGTFHPGPGGVSGSDNYIGFDATNYPNPVGFASGNVVGTSTTGFADGFFVSTSGDLTTHNGATVNVTGKTWAAGFEMEIGGNAVFNNNQTLQATVTGADGVAFGVFQVADGSSAINNNSIVTVNANGDDASAIGLFSVGLGGDATATNNNTINANASTYAEGATGMLASSWDFNASADNLGAITVNGQGDVIGASAFSYDGNATAHNGNAITIAGTSLLSSSSPIGLYAYSVNGDALADNDGTLKVDGDFATGAWAKSFNGNATTDNSDGHSVNANGRYDAVALMAGSTFGDATVNNGGSAYASSSEGNARGVFAYGDTVTVTNGLTGTIGANGYSEAIGIHASGYLGANVTNDGTIGANALGDVFGVNASSYGDTSVLNNGDIHAQSTDGKAYGVYAFGYNAYVNNGRGTIEATSTNKLADGIDAIGVYADARNYGTITATGATSATGVFGLGLASTDVYNAGDVTATATGTNGHAYGLSSIYARYSSADASAINVGAINANGAFASGIEVLAGDEAYAGNGNTVTVRGGDVTGITAASFAYDDGAANIVNLGIVDASGDLFALGAQAIARNFHGDASFQNTGYVYATAQYGSAQGVVVSADISGSVDNQGTIETRGGNSAYGVLALTADGDIDVTNGDTIATYAGMLIRRGDEIAYGVATQSNNGHITIDNDGDIITVGQDTAMGVYAATKWNDVDVTNNGFLASYAYSRAATGVIAITYTGEANVSNGEDGDVRVGGAYSASGLRAIGLYGDANVTNDGDIRTGAGVLDRGITSRSLYGGTATITNNGSISTRSGLSSYGAWARGDFGYAVVDNTGDINAYSTAGVAYGVVSGGRYHSTVDNAGTGDIRAYADGTAAAILAYSNAGDVDVGNAGYLLGESNDIAYGALAQGAGIINVTNAAGGLIVADGYNVAEGVYARGDVVTVDNSGEIHAGASGWAAGIDAVGDTVDVISHTGADVSAFSDYTRATGLLGNASGNATVRNGGTLDAGSTFGDAFGTYAIADGNAVTLNGGDLSAHSTYGYAFGMTAIGYNADLANSKSVKANGYGLAIGMQGIGDAHAIIINNGDVNANAIDGVAAGLYTLAVHDVRQVSNDSVAAHVDNGLAVGMFARGAGRAEMTNRGSVSAVADSGVALGMEVHGDAVTVTNEGTIGAHATDYAAGIYGQGNTVSMVSNTGAAITVFSDHNRAVGMTGDAAGNATVRNGGSLDVGSIDGDVYGSFVVAGGNAVLTNGGTLFAHSLDGTAYAMTGIGYNADLSNSSHVTATGHGAAVGIQGFGDAHSIIINNGDVHADADDGFAFGLYTQADHDVRQVSNVSVDAHVGNGLAIGMYAVGAGRAELTNRGTVNATADTGTAYGMQAIGDTVIIDNEGDVHALASNGAFGLYGSGNGDVSVDSAGYVGAEGKYAAGISAFSDAGDVHVGNTDVVHANGILGVGINAHAAGDVDVVNDGLVDSYGLFAAVGIVAGSDDGAVSIDNLDTVHAYAMYGMAIGVYGFGGDVSIDNASHIDVEGNQAATGIAMVGGDGHVTNRGAITALAHDGDATGVDARVDGALAFDGNGSISAHALGDDGVAIGALLGGDVVHFTNGNDITARADGDGGTAIALAIYGGSTLAGSNSGDVDAIAAHGAAVGAIVDAFDGNVDFTNTGSITAHAAAETVGLEVIGDHDAHIVNGGLIGAIHADHAVALSLDLGGTATVSNTGDIVAQASEEGSIAILGGDGTELITNAGDIDGAMLLGAGNDRFTNNTNGTWIVRGNATDFGAGNDAIANAGRIFLHDASISLGSNSGGGNTFTNTGMLSVRGDSFIDMGTGAPVAPLNNALVASAPMSVLNAAAFTNNGTISFVDGAPDDTLTIAGDFAGQGNLNVDVSLLHGTSDMLYVDGNIASGSVTKLNINVLDLLPSASDIDIPVVVVQGQSNESNVQMGTIVAGQLGFSANNFLNMHVTVKQQISAAAGEFAITMGLDGLNDTGSLAAGIAPGAHSLMASQVGTFRQRMGQFTQLGDSDKGAWVRVFGDKGSINPEAQFSNLPNTGHYGFDQTNQGIEAGFNALITDGVYIGALLGTSKGKQDLDAGLGRDDLDGTTVGASLTWLGTNGMYADVTYRWMHFDADLTSLAGPHKTAGDVGALNIEAGWNVFTSEGGLKLVPQAQYTRSKVENIDQINGDLADFVSNGGTSSRGRVGLELQKTIKSSDNTWTPYGVLSIVREFDGESRFVVADAFAGRTSTEGTSGLLELGVNAKIGQRVDVWGGLNYMDGGAIDGVWGGQLGLRYTW